MFSPCSPEVKNHFEFCFWVFQCPDMFEPINNLRKLLGKLEPDNTSLDNYDEHQLISRLSESLKEKRCLVVVDNFSLCIWKLLRKAIPDKQNGTRLLVISQVISPDRQRKIVADPKDLIHIPPLTNEESLKLLCRKLSDKKDSIQDYPPGFLLMAKEIAILCGGSPINLELLGGHMLLNPSFSPTDVALWDEKFLYSTIDIIPSVYCYLPSVLKTCLAYMASLFPCHYVINADSLVRLWIAEGIVQPEEGRTMEHIAESCLEELVHRYSF
jgi:NB-ARC domain